MSPLAFNVLRHKLSSSSILMLCVFHSTHFRDVAPQVKDTSPLMCGLARIMKPEVTRDTQGRQRTMKWITFSCTSASAAQSNSGPRHSWCSPMVLSLNHCEHFEAESASEYSERVSPRSWDSFLLLLYTAHKQSSSFPHRLLRYLF